MKDILAQNDLIAIVDGEPMATSLALAERTGNQHKNVIELIRNYIDDLQQFGDIAFETRNTDFKREKRAGRATEIANLNEPQCISSIVDKNRINAYAERTYKLVTDIRARKHSGFFMPEIFFMAVEENRITNKFPQPTSCKLRPSPSLFGGINLKISGGHHA